MTLSERTAYRRARIREALRCYNEEVPAGPADAATIERAFVFMPVFILVRWRIRRKNGL